MHRDAARHIEIDDCGVARIAGTRVKVSQLARDRQAYGWSPEEIARQIPHLTLAQVYAALAYYYDHKQTIDEQIEVEQHGCNALAAQTGQEPMKTKGNASGRALTILS